MGKKSQAVIVLFKILIFMDHSLLTAVHDNENLLLVAQKNCSSPSDTDTHAQETIFGGKKGESSATGDKFLFS